MALAFVRAPLSSPFRLSLSLSLALLSLSFTKVIIYGSSFVRLAAGQCSGAAGAEAIPPTAAARAGPKSCMQVQGWIMDRMSCHCQRMHNSVQFKSEISSRYLRFAFAECTGTGGTGLGKVVGVK